MARRAGYVSARAAKRISRAVAAFERGDRDLAAVHMPRAVGDDGDPVRLCKTAAAWNKGTLATLTVYEAGTPPSETALDPEETIEDVVNKFADVAADRWCMVARAGNGSWYLISAEC